MVTKYEDTYKLKGMRKRMVERLEKAYPFQGKIMRAMLEVPRHYFLDPAFAEHCYAEKAFSIGFGQTISHPFTVAFQTHMLDLKPGEKVLEIGTGSGYQAAILRQLDYEVYSVERIPDLCKSAAAVLEHIGLQINQLIGDGTLGYPDAAPYHGIIITAAGPQIPEPLMDQLAIGGKMVIPVGTKERQVLVRITRQDYNTFTKEELKDALFVPLIGEAGW